MFALKIHSVDFPQPLHTNLTSATSTAAAHSNNGPVPSQLMGVVHLFRQLPSMSAPPITIAHVSARTTLVFIVAVPNYMSTDEFLLFCGKEVPHFDDILFLRNDAMEDRYSVLIRLESQLAADRFYCSYNGKRFKPTEVQVCHIYFAQSVENTDSAEIASIPPAGYTELPSCPVCLERLDPATSGIQSTLCDHSFHCSCVSKWTILSCPVCQLCQQQDEQPACAICGTFKSLWICLICGFVGCGRYEKGHARGHWSDKHHHFSLDLEKQQIWDYVGDRYVHRLNQSKADGKSVAVNSRCSSVDECGTCGSGEEDEGLDGALFSSKIEGHLPPLPYQIGPTCRMVTTRSTEQRLEGLEKVVEELSAVVQGFRASQASTEAKLDALLTKLSISLDGNDEESGPTSGTDQIAPVQVLQKMDLPCFDGTDALGWLARADQYFLVHETPLEQRLKLALIAMSGPAMSWVQLLLRRCPTLNWASFTRELLIRFGESSTINGYEALGATKQIGSLEDYIAAFEGRVSQLPDLSDEQYLGFFLGGLQKKIRMQIQDSTITDYSAAVHMARKIDHSDNPPSFSSPPHSTTNYSSWPSSTQQPPSGAHNASLISNTTNSATSRSPRRFRHMTDEEYLKHRAAGTCFKCGLKFGPTHRCPPKTLHVLVGCHDSDPWDEEEGIGGLPPS